MTEKAAVPAETADLQEAKERAARAKQELAVAQQEIKQLQGDASPETAKSGSSPDAVEQLRREPMMAHLLDALSDGKDIGHYGRLVFAMVAHHFLPEHELLAWLQRDPDFSDEAARALIRQVEVRDYNPPRRDRILAWQSEQEFPILPNPDDPDCGNVYRNLKFPDGVYEHIQEYEEKKAESEGVGDCGRAA